MPLRGPLAAGTAGTNDERPRRHVRRGSGCAAQLFVPARVHGGTSVPAVEPRTSVSGHCCCIYPWQPVSLSLWLPGSTLEPRSPNPQLDRTAVVSFGRELSQVAVRHRNTSTRGCCPLVHENRLTSTIGFDGHVPLGCCCISYRQSRRSCVPA